MVYATADLIAKFVLRAVESAARQQAESNSARHYISSRTSSTNPSVDIATDDQPGLRVVEWVSKDPDILQDLNSAGAPATYVGFRLWPIELYSGEEVGFEGT